MLLDLLTEPSIFVWSKIPLLLPSFTHCRLGPTRQILLQPPVLLLPVVVMLLVAGLEGVSDA